MLRERSILLMLLTPLLLGLLVFFAIQPWSNADLETGLEPDVEELCEGLFDLEEQVEGESEALCADRPALRQISVVAAFGRSGCMFCPPSANVSLASGWSLPLRI